MGKEILNGYTGIKFNAEQMSDLLPEGCKDFISVFKKTGKRLLTYNMAPANGGNISTRFGNGFLITASRCNLGDIEDDEVVYVEDFSIEKREVKYKGTRLPSSETFLHGLLYEKKKDIRSVIHAHDAVATSMNLSNIIDETEREEPYGTVELAELCLKTFTGENEIIVLKNHGYVAVGSSLTHATDIIIAMHNRLIHMKEI
jgi:L-fuculose-phosphate aldolase